MLSRSVTGIWGWQCLNTYLHGLKADWVWRPSRGSPPATALF